MNNPKPFLGRLKVEVVREDVNEHMKKRISAEKGISEEFLNKFDLVHGDMIVDPHTGQRQFKTTNVRVPICKGIVIEMAPDAFGKAFQDRYGDVGYVPKDGDIVYFVPNESYRLDVEDKYHLIADCDVVAYERGNNNERSA